MMPFSRMDEGARSREDPSADDFDLDSGLPSAVFFSGCASSWASAFSSVASPSRDSSLGSFSGLSPSPFCSGFDSSLFAFSSLPFGLGSSSFLELLSARDSLDHANVVSYPF
jgi:hypothetical protein